MKSKLMNISKLLFLTVLLCLYQNCAPVKDIESSDLSSTANTSESDPADLASPGEGGGQDMAPVNTVEPNKPEGPVVTVEPEPQKPIEVVQPTPEPEEPPVDGSNMNNKEVCNVHVANSGKNTNSGAYSKPVKDVYTAIKKINNKGTVCFFAGSYNQIKLQNINASKQEPLVLMAHPKSKGKVFIVGANVSRGIGISIYSSKNIFVKGFNIKNLQKGISYYSVIGGGIHDNHIERVGLEGIHVGAHLNYNTRKFEDGPSSYIDVVNNKVLGTGYHIINGQRHQYGEGIYIGTGAQPGDLTHNILVKGNLIKDTSAEAIEVKPYTQYIDVIENTIENIDLQYSGAITIAITNRTVQNTYCRVIGNIIKNVKTRKYSIAGVAVGNGTTEVLGNTISGVEGGRAIRVVKAFHNKNARKVIIKNNTIYGGRIAINDGDSGYPGMTGVVESSGNIIKP